MVKFEQCNVNTCIDELISLGNINTKMWTIFTWIAEHGSLEKGTQADIIKLYINNTLVGYSLFENYERRTDKRHQFNSVNYQDLGVIHFVTLEEYRNKGYGSLLANRLYEKLLEPLLLRHHATNAYVVATGRAVSLMQRTNISPLHLITQFYSDVSFEEKVVNYLKKQQ